MSTVKLEAYLVYSEGDEGETKEKVLKESLSLDRIEDAAVGLCSEYGFHDTFVKEESDSSELTFSSTDTKRKRKLKLVLKGKEETLQEIEDTGILVSD